jgi:hypothetical protein
LVVLEHRECGRTHNIPNTRGVGLIKTVLPVRNAP